MKAAAAALVLGILTGNAFALNKCVQGGRTIYTDGPCEAGAAASELRTYGGTAPSARSAQAAPAQGGTCQPDPTPVNPSDARCKFPSYSYGDEKGKALAADAKAECLQNLAVKRACGNGESREAYQLWKDHHDQMVQKRNAQRPATCRSTGGGQVTCN